MNVEEKTQKEEFNGVRESDSGMAVMQSFGQLSSLEIRTISPVLHNLPFFLLFENIYFFFIKFNWLTNNSNDFFVSCQSPMGALLQLMTAQRWQIFFLINYQINSLVDWSIFILRNYIHMQKLEFLSNYSANMHSIEG